MTNPVQLYQLSLSGNEDLLRPISNLLENGWPEPLAVSLQKKERETLWHLHVLYDHKPDVDRFSLFLKDQLELDEAPQLKIEKLMDKDWVSHVQSELSPVRAGRFFIYGSHDEAKAVGEPYPILMNAGQAFGTAHHGTTRGCLELIDKLGGDKPAQKVLDIGTGTGILSIAARLVWPEVEIIASDIDPVAIKVAEQNFDLNQLGGKEHIKLLVADGPDHKVIKDQAPYDLVIANILKEPILAMKEQIANYVDAKGWLILSGLLDAQQEEIVKAYGALGISLVDEVHIDGWASLLFGKN